MEKRRRKRTSYLFLAGTMLAGAFCVQAEAREIKSIDAAAKLKYVLTSAGTITEDERLQFYLDTCLVSDGETFSMISVNGEPFISGLAASDYIGNGLYTVREPMEETDVNKAGLVTAEGEILIPCEAASIVAPHNRDKNGIRFLEVIYATEETDNEDEGIIYFTEDMFSFSMDEDDVLYKGYARIFDVQEQQFVEGVEFDKTARYGFYDLGDAFAVEHGDTTTMFDADGNQLWETSGYIEGETAHALAASSDMVHTIVNSEGNITLESDYSFSDCCKALDYFTIYDSYDADSDKPYHIIDMDGNRLSEDTYAIVYNAAVNSYYVKYDMDEEDGTVVTPDGTVIAENVYTYNPVLGSYGYISFQDSDDFILVTPDSWYPDLQNGYSSQLFFAKDDAPVILNTGETLAAAAGKEGTAILPGLYRVQQDSSSGWYIYGLYDLFTGEELLPAQYDDIKSAGDYIYAKTESDEGTTWDIYKIDLVPAE